MPNDCSKWHEPYVADDDGKIVTIRCKNCVDYVLRVSVKSLTG